MELSEQDKVQLAQMVSQSNAENYTKEIRDAKNSGKIKKSIEIMLEFMEKNEELLNSNKDEFERQLLEKDNILFFDYFQLYNKILKKQVDLSLLNEMLTVLKKIEDGKLDQHEGSVVVGRLLKTIYIDSVVKENMDNDKKALDNKNFPNQGKTLSWREFKNKNYKK